jgi:hypothetical protein
MRKAHNTYKNTRVLFRMHACVHLFDPPGAERLHDASAFLTGLRDG